MFINKMYKMGCVIHVVESDIINVSFVPVFNISVLLLMLVSVTDVAAFTSHFHYSEKW